MSEARERIYEVHDAQDRTFHWLFDFGTVTFVDWLQNDKMIDKPIFWISGKPGSGKSTLMKFAMHDARTLDCLAKASSKTWTIAAFFFHDRGSEIQKSLGGMLQEILHSILVQVPALSTFVTPLYLKLVKSQRTRSPKWDMPMLREALLAITRQRQVEVQLCLFIDALDEHMGDNEHLAHLLKDIVKNSDGEVVELKICIASRSWTVFTQHFGNCPGFAIHEHTAKDISVYIQSRLTTDTLGSQLSLDQTQRRTILDQVAGKAVGVFIWVRLVMDLITKDIRDGTNFAALEDRITNMPKELEDIYAHTVRRIEPEYRSDAYIMLQIALCSLTPLPLDSFLTVTRHNIGTPARALEDLSPTMQLRTISSRGGGLLEAVCSLPSDEEAKGLIDRRKLGGGLEKAESHAGVYHVQFIHQTVKQYVREHQDSLGKTLFYQGSGYAFLLNSICKELHFNSRSPTLGRQDVFLYAKLYEESSQTLTEEEIESYLYLMDDVSQFIAKVGVALWCSNTALQNYLRKGSDCFSSKVSQVFVGLAVAANLNIYVSNRAIGTALSEQDIYFGQTFCLLKIVIRGLDILPPQWIDRPRMIKTLIKIGYIGDWPSDSYLGDDRVQCTPLGLLIPRQQEFDSSLSEAAKLQCARTLLENGANSSRGAVVYFFDGSKVSSVHSLRSCVQFGSAAWVRLLLQYNSMIDNEEGGFLNLLDYAVIRGSLDIIQVLEDHGYTHQPQPTLTPIQAVLLTASHVCVAPLGAPASKLFLAHRRAKVTEID